MQGGSSADLSWMSEPARCCLFRSIFQNNRIEKLPAENTLQPIGVSAEVVANILKVFDDHHAAAPRAGSRFLLSGHIRISSILKLRVEGNGCFPAVSDWYCR